MIGGTCVDISTVWVADHIVITCAPHRHEYYQLIYCRGGIGKVGIGNELFPAKPGYAYLAKENELHSLNPKENLALVEIKFTTESRELSEMLSRLPSEFYIDGNDELRDALYEIVSDGLSNKAYSYEVTNSRILIFLLKLLGCNNISGANAHRSFSRRSHEHQSTESARDAELLKVMDYIEKHFTEPIELDNLARLVHFSKSYLVVRFKELWGVPPIKYVNFLRIESAKQLLLVSDKNITDIASDVGFSGIHYFSRYFKERVGVTPNEYRLGKRASE